jgi:hypothetical protein
LIVGIVSLAILRLSVPSKGADDGVHSNAQNGRAPCAPGAFGAHPFHRGPHRAREAIVHFSSDSRQRQRLSFIPRGW